MKRINEEGQKVISDLFGGDVGAFIYGNRKGLIADINAMYAALGKAGEVTEDIVARVVANLKDRLSKAHTAELMPKLSYSMISFSRTDNAMVSPWGQAFSLLVDIAVFPRKALTDSFFFRGLKVAEDDLIEVMNVMDDALLHDLRARGIKERCRAELNLLSKIESASIEAKHRCGLVLQILAGDALGPPSPQAQCRRGGAGPAYRPAGPTRPAPDHDERWMEVGARGRSNSGRLYIVVTVMATVPVRARGGII